MNQAKPKLVMVGNGMAGVRTLEELLKQAPTAYDITVIGAEPYPNYNRIMLSPVLAGEQQWDDIILNDHDWYTQHGIRLHTGQTVVAMDRAHQRLICASGLSLPYDHVLLATGSNPFVLPIPGHDLPGVVTFRDIADVESMIAATKQYRRAVVIGGGLLGLEAANGLLARGMEVTVVHVGARLLDRQLDETAAHLLQTQLEARGLRFLLSRHTVQLQVGENGRVASVLFQEGDVVAADLVVMAVGIRPNAQLAAQAGLPCERGGVVVDDYLQTIDAAVSAVGECVSHRGVTYGLVAPLYDMAKVVATRLAGQRGTPYVPVPTATKLKITGIHLFSAGNFQGGEGCQCVTLFDPIHLIYKKLVFRDDYLVGVCLYGDTADGNWYFRLMSEQRPVANARDALLLGEAAAGCFSD